MTKTDNKGPEKKKVKSSGKAGTVKQLFSLLIEKKAWWLIPMVIVFILLGLLIVFTQSSAIAPFIYPLF